MGEKRFGPVDRELREYMQQIIEIDNDPGMIQQNYDSYVQA